AGDLRRCGVSGQDLRHGRGGLVGGDVAARGERSENRGPAAELVEAGRSHGRGHRRPDGLRALRGAAALANDPATLFFGASSPHAVALSEPERVLEARFPYRTAEAHGLCNLGLLIGCRVEDLWVEATACSLVAPQEVHLGKITPSRDIEVQVRAT